MKLDLNILPSPSPLAVHDCHPSYFSPTHHSRQDIWALFHSLVLFLVCMFILLALFCLLVVANLTLYSLVKLTSPLFTQKSYQTHRALSVHLHSIPFVVIPVPRLFFQHGIFTWPFPCMGKFNLAFLSIYFFVFCLG